MNEKVLAEKTLLLSQCLRKKEIQDEKLAFLR